MLSGVGDDCGQNDEFLKGGSIPAISRPMLMLSGDCGKMNL
jgi:hypothetical protein